MVTNQWTAVVHTRHRSWNTIASGASALITGPGLGSVVGSPKFSNLENNMSHSFKCGRNLLTWTGLGCNIFVSISQSPPSVCGDYEARRMLLVHTKQDSDFCRVAPCIGVVRTRCWIWQCHEQFLTWVAVPWCRHLLWSCLFWLAPRAFSKEY